jgi:hypothetical protein
MKDNDILDRITRNLRQGVLAKEDRDDAERIWQKSKSFLASFLLSIASKENRDNLRFFLNGTDELTPSASDRLQVSSLLGLVQSKKQFLELSNYLLRRQANFFIACNIKSALSKFELEEGDICFLMELKEKCEALAPKHMIEKWSEKLQG